MDALTNARGETNASQVHSQKALLFTCWVDLQTDHACFFFCRRADPQLAMF